MSNVTRYVNKLTAPLEVEVHALTCGIYSKPVEPVVLIDNRMIKCFDESLNHTSYVRINVEEQTNESIINSTKQFY